ncbi:arylamine N-acetyltransferase family protein [Actinopolyspora mortivallis]|uniref:arylamine N-acetyltransferase family protein n=1 Tax=Actinopolyspora mortivallis TaxID=33906 RepID=UPI000363DC91|nr:arylamine N-acetyltransferase [Actinopolyspora mortivallis]
MPEKHHSSEWESEDLDVESYLRRIGDTGRPDGDPATLGRLHRAHAMSIPFENLDIVLQRPVPLDMDSMQRKILAQPRGGCCYEHNLLFAALLERLGHRVLRVFARPLLGAAKPLPNTHLMLLVPTTERTFLVDVGFGDDGPSEPIPLTDGVRSEQDGWVYQLDRSPDGVTWVLSLLTESGPLQLYRFGTDPQHQIDCVAANHFISTHPRSPFTGRVFLERKHGSRRFTLNNRELSTKDPGKKADVVVLDDGDVAEVIRDTFGIGLSDSEAEHVRASLPRPAQHATT